MRYKISLKEIIEIYEMELDDINNYYNKLTGKIVMLSKEDIELAESDKNIEEIDEWKQDIILEAKDFIENPCDYIKLPNRDEFDEYNTMEKFIKNCNNEEFLKLVNSDVQGESAFRQFKSSLYSCGLIDEWYKVRDNEFEKFIIEWCKDKNLDCI